MFFLHLLIGIFFFLVKTTNIRTRNLVNFENKHSNSKICSNMRRSSKYAKICRIKLHVWALCTQKRVYILLCYILLRPEYKFCKSLRLVISNIGIMYKTVLNSNRHAGMKDKKRIGVPDGEYCGVVSHTHKSDRSLSIHSYDILVRNA